MSKPFKMKAAGHNNSPMQKNFPKDISANPGDTPLEKFSWGAALGGALKGAKAGAVAGPWGIVAGALGGGALSGFSGGAQQEKQEAEQKKQEAEQKAAQMSEDQKNKLIAEAAADEERESLGYSGF